MGRESRLIGQRAEERATTYLIDEGFTILERNFHSRFGEIDIVAQRDGVVHFVEVKYSKAYEPIVQITPAKMMKLYRAIEYYRLTKNLSLPYQIDALLIKDTSIELVENISL